MRFFFGGGGGVNLKLTQTQAISVVDHSDQFSVISILVNIITVKPFSLLLTFVAYFQVAYELRS